MEITHAIHTLEEMLNASGGCRSTLSHSWKAGLSPSCGGPKWWTLALGDICPIWSMPSPSRGGQQWCTLALGFALFGACFLHRVEAKNGADVPSVVLQQRRPCLLKA